MNGKKITPLLSLVLVIGLIILTLYVAFELRSRGTTQTTTLVSGQLKNYNGLDASTKFKDGTYSALGSYFSPAGNESLNIELTLESGEIKSLIVTPNDPDLESLRYQQKFISGVNSLIIGRPITQSLINGNVNGSSLTGEGFNMALIDIMNQAKIS